MADACVFYFFQGELGENLSTPNAFLIPGTRNPTLGDFLSHFPLPSDDFHFRFKFDDKAYGYSWMDVTDEKETLPMKGGILTAKVLRLDAPSTTKRKLFLKKHMNPQFGRDAPPAQADSRASNTSTNSVRPAASLARPASAPPKPQQPAADYDFFSGSSAPTSPAATTSATSPSGPAGDIDEGPRAPPPPPVVLDRHELQEKREEEIQGRVDAALKEKKERDVVLAKEGEDTDLAKATHDARLTLWAFNNNEKRNVRTLLSTMHTVLWEGNKWKPIGLGDVIDPNKVKLNYRKAMLVVHPDRISNQSPEIRFIGKRIFEAVNDAYQDFLKKEGL